MANPWGSTPDAGPSPPPSAYFNPPLLRRLQMMVNYPKSRSLTTAANLLWPVVAPSAPPGGGSSKFHPRSSSLSTTAGPFAPISCGSNTATTKPMATPKPVGYVRPAPTTSSPSPVSAFISAWPITSDLVGYLVAHPDPGMPALAPTWTTSPQHTLQAPAQGQLLHRRMQASFGSLHRPSTASITTTLHRHPALPP